MRYALTEDVTFEDLRRSMIQTDEGWQRKSVRPRKLSEDDYFEEEFDGEL